MPGDFPERIVCLTEETTKTLYLLGEDARIVALAPDLVPGFSDLQADIAAAIARAGLEVHLCNHGSVPGILGMIRMLGGMIGCEAEAAALAVRLAEGVERVRMSAASLPRRPRVYLEEWDEPPISAIRWVGELIGIAGGDNCFPELAAMTLGRDRIIAALTDGLAGMHALIRRWAERLR